ncbi:hypothetical protein [Polluticoccus soli]|uniref:hypothetical protein n=1 Tax=Polluticoccus soli TaxID=3034150 RepID=UPI0023E2F993|nr:hypothetical protein [Flavipsychrobacter sp. JY13-12]
MRFIPVTLLMLLSLASAAQQFKIGISAHALYHSGTSSDSYIFGSQQGAGYGGAISLAQSHDWIELKYAFETGSMRGRKTGFYNTANAVPVGTPIPATFSGSDYQAIADQYYLPYVAANLKFPLFRFKPYAGVLLALVKTNGSGKMYVYQYSNVPFSFQPFHMYGVGAGIQAGGSLMLSRHFELTGELAYRRMWLNEFIIAIFGSAHSIAYQLNTWQFNAGINYVFDWNED